VEITLWAAASYASLPGRVEIVPDSLHILIQRNIRTRRSHVMANEPDRPEAADSTAGAKETGTEAGGDGPGARSRQPGQVQIDDSKVVACYANFCRVTGTPEELIIDFGLNQHPFGVPSEPVPVTQRIVTNYYTAKRLLQVLHASLQRHEATFGVLETDVQKRVRPGVARPARPPE
jgi:hypothetical protein